MSPRTVKQNMEIRAKTRQRILNSSLKLFGQYGFENTSVNSIAKDAKMAKGLIYNHFDTKVDIVKGLVEMLIDTGEKLMGSEKQFKSPKHHLKQIIDDFFQFTEQQNQIMSWMLPLAFQIGRYPFVTELVAGKIQAAIGISVQIFKEMGYPDPKQEAWFFGAILDGIGMDLILVSDYPSDEMHQYLLKKYELNKL